MYTLPNKRFSRHTLAKFQYFRVKKNTVAKFKYFHAKTTIKEC
jgi:hypothetical protein